MDSTGKRALTLHETDNVANALSDLEPGDLVMITPGGYEVEALDSIPFGFKIAVKALAKGEAVYKYGHQIGISIMEIKIGQCVHVHNIEGCRGRGDKAAQWGNNED
jgi:altronate dehydratase small subunit